MQRLAATAIALAFLVVSATTHAAELRIAVMPFANASADASLDPLGAGLQAMLTTDLAATNAIQLVERARLGEIQTELALAQSSAIDPTTAAKIGKLAGATHLLAGAFTVVGKTMRIDARLIEVDSGLVFISSKHEGEKDAFFELEKALVNDIVRALKVTVPPRERATLARIHTADFAAFESYSKGLFYFDQKRYEDAVAELRKATTQDPDFQLARVQLGEYDALIAKMKARLPTLEAELPNLYRQGLEADALDHRKILEGLVGAAQEPGLPRLVALYQLAIYQGPFYHGNFHFNRVRFVEDRFLLDRLAETYSMAYWVEAQAAWPKVPLFITNRYAGDVPFSLATFEVDEPRWIRNFLRGDTEAIIAELTVPNASAFARLLRLDATGAARMLTRAYELVGKLDPGRAERVGQDLGKYLRSVGLIAESSAIFAAIGQSSVYPGVVRDAQHQLEVNRLYLAALDKHASDPRVREWLLVGGFPDRSNIDAAMIEAEAQAILTPTSKTLEVLNRGREFDHFAIIGDVPMWALDVAEFTTGPISAVLRSTSFSYFRVDDDPTVWLAIAGAERGTDLEARFEIDHTPSKDWWHKQATPVLVAKVPETTFLFGARDLDVALLPGRGPERRLMRGVAGYGLVITATRASLVEVSEREVFRAGTHQRNQLLYRELAHVSLPPSKQRKVALSIEGKVVKATVAGKTAHHDAARSAAGLRRLRLPQRRLRVDRQAQLEALSLAQLRWVSGRCPTAARSLRTSRRRCRRSAAPRRSRSQSTRSRRALRARGRLRHRRWTDNIQP